MRLMEELKELLSNNKKFVSDGKILKNKVVELALKLDKDLIKLLLSNEIIKEHFFIDVDETLIFDKEKFMKFVDNKEFLPDSYTSFKNKIGLTASGSYISQNKEVVLAWPYKDCILEGGQEKSDEKRKEVFHNEILASDEIDRLLAPKVFTKFKRIDKNGEHEIGEIKETDNLLIRGNNLLVLHSLRKKFAGKVKLIYIDPPYNTGSDSFKYNDNFNHSTWLTFMKNRLSIAKQLLSETGCIFIQIDHHEVAYINILLDEIFGIENKIQIIAVKTASASGFKAVNPGPIDITEFILFYAKNKDEFKFKKNYIEADYHENYNLYLEKNNSNDVDKWKLISLKEKVLIGHGYSNEKQFKDKYGDTYNIILKDMLAKFAFENSEFVVSVRDLHKPTETVRNLQEKSKRERGKIFIYKKKDDSPMFLYNGGSLAFYSSKIKEIDGEVKVTELLSNFWDHISWAGIANEGGVKLKNGKKPEKLIKQIFEIATESGDIVLDYHLGSGTTAAVAHKMDRHYIGIEQLDYGNNDSVARLANTIKGEQSGISRAVNWQGGSDFVYMELAKLNESFINMIQDANNKSELLIVWDEMKIKGFLSYRVNPSLFDENIEEFKKLSFEEQKKLLIETLDKNDLYVNYSEIDDGIYKIDDEDKKLNREFYGDF